jgi:hypothetical protein
MAGGKGPADTSPAVTSPAVTSPAVTSPAVTSREVLRQAVSDWFGKEVQNGYTVTYVWMTNQLGHFTLGFLFTFIVTWIVEAFLDAGPACPWWAVPLRGFASEGQGRPACAIDESRFLCGWLLAIPIVQILFWIAKEVRDYFVAVRAARGNAFPIDRMDIAGDAATAVFFITIGIAVSYISFVSWGIATAVFFVSLAVALFPARYWMSRKLCFQRAALPFLYRLADFPKVFAPKSPLGAKDVLAFIASRSAIEHLLIFGPRGAGRTSLAVGMATEHTFSVRRARYMTWAKFIEQAQENPEPTLQDGAEVWPWRESDIVVLDDVVGEVDNRALVGPGDIRGVLLALSSSGKAASDVLTALAARRTVWVVGPVDDSLKSPEDWRAMLAATLNASIGKIGYVELAGAAWARPSVPVSSFSGH